MPKQKQACRQQTCPIEASMQTTYLSNRSKHADSMCPIEAGLQAAIFEQSKEVQSPIEGFVLQRAHMANKLGIRNKQCRQQKAQTKPATRSYRPRRKRHASIHFEQSKEAKSQSKGAESKETCFPLNLSKCYFYLFSPFSTISS